MTLKLKLLTAPKDEPVTVDEAMLHARIDDSVEAPIVAGMIKAARELAETYTRRALITQTWQLFLDAFPAESFIELPRAPLQSVTHVKTYTDADVAATFASSNYYVDAVGEPCSIVLRGASSWPDVGRVVNGVEIQFVAGYGGPDAVPSNIKQAILMMVAEMYEFRNASVTGTLVQEISQGPYALLASERIWRV